MAVQTIKKGQLLTVPATEDELILSGPFNMHKQEVRFTNVSGTSKFGIGGPVFSDSNAFAYPDPSNSIHRVHCSGSGTWKVEW